MRAAVLVWLVFSPVLAGCLSNDDGDAPRLAQPTDQTPVVPMRQPPRQPTVQWNFSDPGYVLDKPWRLGDAWDYESNLSHFVRVRVRDTRLINGTTYYLVEEMRGDVGGPPESRVTSWVDGKAWLRLNATDEIGGVETFTPGQPLRLLKNATAFYNHTRVEPSGRVSVREGVMLTARHYASHQTLLFPWGYVEARRVEHNATSVDAGGNRSYAVTLRWIHRDYLNDVQFQEPNGEVFRLVGARVGDFRRGEVAS